MADLAILRAIALYVPMAATVAVWCWRRPDQRLGAAAALAFLWNLPALWLLRRVAPQGHWWGYEAEGGLLNGMPGEALLGWALLWGALPALLFRGRALRLQVLAALLL